MSFIMCDITNVKCAMGDCDSCSNFSCQVLQQLKTEVIDHQTKWRSWTTVDGEPTVVENFGLLKECCQQLSELM